MDEISDPASVNPNPIVATRIGQTALKDILSGLRNLMLPLYDCIDPEKRETLNASRAFYATQQYTEAINHMKSNKALLHRVSKAQYLHDIY